MATKEKIVYPKLTTPKGTLIYPWLTKADTKFNPAGEYRTTLAVPADSCEEFCNKLDAILEQFFNEQVEAAKPQDKKKIKKTEPYQPQYDDDGNDTGNTLFKAKLKAEIQMKSGDVFTQKPKLFDAQGNPLPASINPYGGTQARLSVQVVPYMMPATKECGLSLRLQAVQVIQLVQGGSGGGTNSSDYGFSEEDGYVAPEKETFEAPDEESTGDNEDF